jgi:spermidine synthase
MTHLPCRAAHDPHDRSIRMGAIGLGIGTVAAYGQPGDYIRFYEINPGVIKIATDPRGFFSYLRDSPATVEIIPGDARLSMESEVASDHSQNFDVLVVDAFSGDAIPVHLLTREAIEIYLRELAPKGVLAFHISNRYLDLRPVIHELAENFKLRSGWIHSPGARLSQPSDWILLARSNEILGQPEIARQLQSLDSQRKVRLWTDDYSNLFQILK